jgi:hypothetical protein
LGRAGGEGGREGSRGAAKSRGPATLELVGPVVGGSMAPG